MPSLVPGFLVSRAQRGALFGQRAAVEVCGFAALGMRLA